jgi:hypothetical protein
MARDLYGELLANALSRRAPPGHFAAYIQPNEAAMLRSQGGGVAPGGGQYMAQGIPSFQSEPDYDLGGAGMDLGAIGGGYDFTPEGAYTEAEAEYRARLNAPNVRALMEARAKDQAVVDDQQARDAQLRAEQQVAWDEARPGSAPQRGATAAPQVAWDEARPGSAPQRGATAPDYVPIDHGLYEAALATRESNRATMDGYKTNYAQRQEDNFAVINANYTLSTPAQKAAAFDRPISEGGVGRFAPAGILAAQGATQEQLARSMTIDESGGYAITDPQSDVSAPRGFHMGWIPSVMASLIGTLSPPMGLAALAAGYPTVGARVRRGDTELGRILGAPGRIAREVFGPVSDAARRGFEPIGRALTSSARELGDTLRDWLPEGGEPSPRVDIPEGGYEPPVSEGFIPEVATPPEDVDAIAEEAPFVADVPPEILERLRQTDEAGRRRLRQLGLLA